MKHLAPTLATLAVVGLAPAVHGATIADDLTIKPKAVVQARAQFGADATNTAGQDWNLYNGAVGETEAARFSIRRARFGAEAKNTTGWKGVIQFRGGERYDAGARGTYVTRATTTTALTDTNDADALQNNTVVTGVTTSTSDQPRTIELYYANIAKAFKTGAFEHELSIGLDKPFNNESSISSSAFLFPSDRPIAHAIEYRSVGLGYQLNAMETVRFGANIQNGKGWGYTSADESTGMFYSFRVEASPGKDYMPKKKQESYCGAEGTHLLIGFDMQKDADYLNSTGTTQTSVTTLGPDLLVHWNGLTLLAEYRARTSETETIASGASTDFKGTLLGVQAGFAFLMDAGFAIEPAIRFGKVDLDKDNDSEGPNPFDQGEYRAGQSGAEWGIGVNFYWNGMSNKTQVAFNSWQGEEAAAGDKSKARIFTIQQQVTF